MENSDDIDDFLKQLKKKKKRTDKVTTKKVINEVPKVDDKEEDIDVFLTQRKNNKLQKLAVMHSNSDKLYSSLEDDYEESINRPKPKRVFNYTPKPNNEPRIKPTMKNVPLEEDDLVVPSKNLSVPLETHTNPDLYFGVSSTLKVLENENNDISSKKPLFDETIQTLGVDLPLALQEDLKQQI